MRIYHFSDSHTKHRELKVPTDVDMAIFSGDCSNPKDLVQSEIEIRDFLDWYGQIPIRYKLFIAGNHDLALEKRLITPGEFAKADILYLENSFTTIEGLRIFGTPFTPTFNTGWAFNKERAKMHKIWDMVDNNIDIIISHGPPKGVLDLTENRDGTLEQCGDSNMLTQMGRMNPQLCCFGHIHDFKSCVNAGIRKLDGLRTIFSNGSVVEDGKFAYPPKNNGNIINL